MCLAMAAMGVTAAANRQPFDLVSWGILAAVAFALFLGGLVTWKGTTDTLRPARVWHAAPEVLAGVSREPVVTEGWDIHGRLTHELVEDNGQWLLRPDGRLWRGDKRFLVGFGVPFSLVFTGILTWVFHAEMPLLRQQSWAMAFLGAVVVTLVCGVSGFVFIGLLRRSSYRRLVSLAIERGNGEMLLSLPVEYRMTTADSLQGLLLGDSKRGEYRIPLQMIAAVQLCPWKRVVGRSDKEISWAVQSLLVMKTRDEEYIRLPIVLTSDYSPAARLMQKLAEILGVPYLFHADEEGFRVEAHRAKSRPPLQSGGSV